MSAARSGPSRVGAMSVVAPRNRPAARDLYRLNRELLAVGVALDDAGIDDVVRDHLTRRWNELFAELAMTPAPRIGRKVKARWLVAHAQRAGTSNPVFAELALSLAGDCLLTWTDVDALYTNISVAVSAMCVYRDRMTQKPKAFPMQSD
jgi:hypothetical protein